MRLKTFVLGTTLSLIDTLARLVLSWTRRTYADVSRVVIVKDDALGDMTLFAAPLFSFLNAVNEAQRPCEVLLVTDQKAKGLIRALLQVAGLGRLVTVIGLDVRRYSRDIIYRLSQQAQLARVHGAVLCNCRRSPVFHTTDSACRFIGAREKLALVGDCGNQGKAFNSARTLIYDRLIKPDRQTGFEIEFTKRILSETANAINADISFRDSFDLSLSKVTKRNNRVAHLFVGASLSKRRWPLNNFVVLAKKLETLGFVSHFLGIEDDLSQSQYEWLESLAHREPSIVSLIGKLTIEQTVKATQGVSLVVSNDSFGLHLGALFSIPTVGISNGNHYGRFHPYPEGHPHVAVLYPWGDRVVPRFSAECGKPVLNHVEDIRGVSPVGVFLAAKKVLEEVT